MTGPLPARSGGLISEPTDVGDTQTQVPSRQPGCPVAEMIDKEHLPQLCSGTAILVARLL